MATIKDVARLAGVSIATVSNILNNKETVGEEIYGKVYAAMQALNYKPNPMARNLKNNCLNFMGMILPSLSGIYKDIMDGIQRELLENGCYIIIKTTDDIPAQESRTIDEFVNLGVRGIITVTCFNDIAHYKKASDAGIPVLFVERTVDEMRSAYVIFDNHSMTRNIFCRLIDSGVDPNHILLITGDQQFSSERDFVAGALQALDQHNMSSACLWHRVVSQNEVQSYADILDLFHQFHEKPEKIVLSSERMLDSLLDVQTMFGLTGIEIFVPTGDRVTDLRYNTLIHSIPRRAIFCGRQAARSILGIIRNPLSYEDNQIVIPSAIDIVPVSDAHRYKKRILKLLMTNNVMSTAIRKILPAFQNETGIEVYCTFFEYQQDLYNEIVERHQCADNEYDIYMMDSPWMDYFDQISCVRSLDDYLLTDLNYTQHFMPDVWKKINGSRRHVVGIPIVSMVQLMLYRKDLFTSPVIQRLFYKENGIELRVPKTWAEFNAVSRFFTRSQNPSSPTEYGTCLLGRKPNGLIQEFFPRQWSYNGNIMRHGNIVLNSVENLKAVLNLKEAYTTSLPDIWNVMENEQVEQFARGEIAMINTYSGHIKSIIEPSFSYMNDKLGYAVLPGKYSLVGAWLLAINRFCEAPEDAFSLIKWITSDKSAIQCSMIGGIAPNVLVEQNEQIKTLYPWNNNVQAYVRMEKQRETIMNIRGEIVNNYLIEQVLSDGIFDVFLDRCTAEEMLVRCSKEIQRMVSDWR